MGVKKPKRRIPTAKPSKRHSSKKDYKRDSDVKKFKCSVCPTEFFATMIEKNKEPMCISCILFYRDISEDT